MCMLRLIYVYNVFMRDRTCPLMFIVRVYNSMENGKYPLMFKGRVYNKMRNGTYPLMFIGWVYIKMRNGTYEDHLISFQPFFVWALLLIVHTWNSSRLRSNLFQLQCTCSTVPTTSGRPHGNPLVWACQWPSSQPLSSTQLSYNGSLRAYGISKSHREQGLDYRDGKELSWFPSWSKSM